MSDDFMGGEISSVGIHLFNKVKNYIFEKEPIEKAILRKADFEKIIEEKTDIEEFPVISHKDIKVICEILRRSTDIELIIKELYVFRSGKDRSLSEINDDFVSLFPQEIELGNRDRNLGTEERLSFLLKVFEVLDEGIQLALNRAADEGSAGAFNALSNRRYFVINNKLTSEFRDIKRLISDESKGAQEREVLSEKLPSLFISYAREDDEPFVEKLYQDLTERGFSVWWDRTAMKNRGRTFLQEIRDAIEESDLLIAVVGPKAIESDTVQSEWEHALLFSKGVVPILLIGDYDLLPEEISKLHCPDFREKRPYEEALEELLRLLSEPIPPLGPMIAVPSLPPSYLPRTEDLKKIKELILADTVKPVVITSAKQITAVQGMGGMGKSILSTAFARTTETRRAFYDGVFWITVGLDPDLIGDMRLIGTKFGDDPANYSGKKEAEASLSKALSNKACLVVLDDVWKVPHATPFVNALGSRCRMLITTRNDDVVTSLGAQEHKIKVLSKTEALQLLANWCEQEVDSLSSEAAEVAEECGYLPLALSICGAMAKSGIAWSDILEALQEADLEFIEAQLPNYPNTSVMKALKVSVDFLSSEDPAAVQRYQELAIFPADEAVPEAAVVTFWKHTGNLKKRYVGKLLTKLKDRSLLRLDGEAPNRLISLHDLQFDYLREMVDDLISVHNQLLEAYHQKCKNGWSSGPKDGYYFERLPHHLVESGRKGELQRLLLDFGWLVAKLNTTDANSLITDYNYLSNDSNLQLLQGAIRLSAHTLSLDKMNLQSQLYGRLITQETPEIRNILDQIRQFDNSCWLCPLTASLIPPGGPLIRTLQGHSDSINAVAVTPDGSRAVSASDDKTIKVWDIETGEQIKTLQGHSGRVLAVAVTSDGSRVISGSSDNTLKVWDLETGEQIRTLNGHTLWIWGVAVTPDGSRVISASYDKTIKVWDIETGEQIKTLQGHAGRVLAVAVTSDGSRVISGSSDKTLKVWDLETGTQIKTLSGHTDGIRAVAVMPGNLHAISASHDETLKVWNLKSGEQIKTLSGHTAKVNAVTVTSDGRLAVSASEDETIKVWDVETGGQIKTMVGHTQWIWGVAITPDGCRAVSASHDETLKVWNLGIREQVKIPQSHTQWINAVTVTLDGHHVISGSSDETLKIWDIETGKQIKTLQGHTGSVNTVVVTSDCSRVISGSSDKTIKVWDIETGKQIKTLNGPDSINAVTVTPNDRLVISASYDETLKVWDMKTGEQIKTLKGHTAKVNKVAITFDGRRVISGSSDKTLKIWDIETGEQIKTLQGHTGSVNAVVVTSDGSRVISGSSDKTIKVWDIETGTEIKTLNGHTQCVWGVAVTPDGSLMVSASDDKTIKVWDMKNMEELASFSDDGSLLSCTISPDGKTIVAAGSSSRMHFLRIKGVD